MTYPPPVPSVALVGVAGAVGVAVVPVGCGSVTVVVGLGGVIVGGDTDGAICVGIGGVNVVVGVGGVIVGDVGSVGVVGVEDLRLVVDEGQNVMM